MTRKQEKAQSQQKHKSKSLTTGDLTNTCFQYSFRYLCCVFSICVSDTCTVDSVFSICVSDTCTVFLIFVFPVQCFQYLCFLFSVFSICVSDTCTVVARSISASAPSIQIREEGRPSRNLEYFRSSQYIQNQYKHLKMLKSVNK